MQDRIPTYPGRVKLTPVTGEENIYDMERADEPTQVGTPLNKATLLTDSTETAIWGDAQDRTVDEALKALNHQIGDTLTTVRTNLDDSWLLCNGATVQSADYPILSALMPGLQNGIYSSLQLDFSSTGADTGPDVLVTNGDNVFVGSLDNGRMIYTNDINANPPVWGTSANSVGSYSTDMICYGDGCWAAAFNLSAFYTNIYTATDPSGSWSSTQIHLQYDRNIVYITFGDGYFVALGNGSICYTQTPDVRESWEQSEISGGICYMIAYGNGYWVVSQESGYIAYSNSLSGSFTRKQISSGRMEGIYFLNGIWLAINSQGLLYTATDPTGEWVQNTSAPEMYTSTTNKQTMLYDNGLYIAIAVINSANQLVFATDPTGEWTPIPTAWNPSSITGANGTYVAGGYRITDDLIGLPQISLDKTYTYIKAK